MLRHRTSAVPLIVAALALAAAGCDSAPKTSTATPPAPAPTSATAAATAAATSAAPAAIVTETNTATDGVMLKTPSGNIGCGVLPDGVRCTILSSSWTAPSKPANCDLDWGSNIVLDATRGAYLICAGDSTLTSDAKVLAYGHALRVGTVVCTSTETSLRCELTTTRHGFTLAKERYTLF